MLLTCIYCVIVRSAYSATYAEERKDKAIVKYAKELQIIAKYFDPSKTSRNNRFALYAKKLWLEKISYKMKIDSLNMKSSVSGYFEHIEKESYQDLYESESNTDKLTFSNLNDRLCISLQRISKIKREIKSKFGTLKPLTNPEYEEYDFHIWTYDNYELKSANLSDVSCKRDFLRIEEVSEIFYQLILYLGRYADLLTIKYLREFNPSLTRTSD
ncbi:hypothetical protein P3W45_000784 [Vairimorpha bombi]|jgi:hypothetical protein